MARGARQLTAKPWAVEQCELFLEHPNE
jgi:hypothetical protein